MFAMVSNLTCGALVISLNVIVHTVGLVLLARWMSWSVQWFRLTGIVSAKPSRWSLLFWAFSPSLRSGVWIWAFAYLATGFVNSLEEAVYFSTVTFSTLGYGDIIPPPGWRVFAALEA